MHAINPLLGMASNMDGRDRGKKKRERRLPQINCQHHFLFSNLTQADQGPQEARQCFEIVLHKYVFQMKFFRDI